MFTEFKAQFLWCIMCTFLTGILCGTFIMMIDYKNINIIIGILVFLSIVFTSCFWKVIFKRLDLRDKLNSIYTDID